jgi:hypothetical protein
MITLLLLFFFGPISILIFLWALCMFVSLIEAGLALINRVLNSGTFWLVCAAVCLFGVIVGMLSK